jgi:cyclase
VTQSTRPPIRVIARLDIKGKNLIKGVQMEGLRVLGDPNEFARRYYAEGIDEILYIDTVASLYGRSYITEILEATVSDVFVPITVGGGVKSVDDVKVLLRSGADKVAINSEAVRNPHLISEIADAFGEQCTVASIQAKKTASNNWEVLIEGGRERTGLDVVEWASEVTRLGAGEILVTSVDKDGTKKGFDNELVAHVRSAVRVPVIASGGFGSTEDFGPLLGSAPNIDAVSVGTALHYGVASVSDIRSALREWEESER